MSDIEDIIEEVRLLFHCATQIAERLHSDEAVTISMRGVLEYLHRHGPTVVPTMARDRHVSRQHIQTLVNALLEAELVRLDENPAHRRSSLVGLTPEGQRVIRRMRDREAAHLADIDLAVSAAELARATKTLSRLRGALEGQL